MCETKAAGAVSVLSTQENLQREAEKGDENGSVLGR